MNEKLQYAEMLGIPVSTSSVTYRPIKKTRKSKKIDADKVKDELINKINSAEVDKELELNSEERVEKTEEIKKPIASTLKSKFKLTVVGIELIVIGLLLATIFITNALVPDSGINVFFRSVFSNDVVKEEVDLRTHKDFEVVLPVSSTQNIAIDDGKLNLYMTGSLYSPLDGEVTNLTLDQETNKYTIEITHSDNFKTVFFGLDYAYSEVGSSVYANIPVGYVNDCVAMCFCDGDGTMITGYSLTENQVVWEV